jgi:hypothetical protein
MIDEGKATWQAPIDDGVGVHRLRDIVVEEVSLVDRAANKRRFLVVKRSNEMTDGKSKGRGKPQEGSTGAAHRETGKKPKPKQDGDVDKVRPRVMRAASEEDNEEDDETEKARRSRSAREEVEEDEGGDSEAEAAKAASLDGDEESEEDGDDGTAGARPKRSGKPAEKADDEDDLVLPSTVKNAVLQVLAQALERLMALANQVKDADEPDDDTDANVPDDFAGELEDIGELLEDISEQLADPTEKAAGKKPGAAKQRAEQAGVTKAGARMAKDRLDRFQKALELLSSVLKELTEAKTLNEPSAGSAENPLAKRDGAPGLGDLVASVRDLTRVVKRQEDELVRLQKTRATSNAIPVDGGSRRREPQDVSWPLDMNRPISRDSVAKAVSFYE